MRCIQFIYIIVHILQCHSCRMYVRHVCPSKPLASCCGSAALRFGLRRRECDDPAAEIARMSRMGVSPWFLRLKL